MRFTPAKLERVHRQIEVLAQADPDYLAAVTVFIENWFKNHPPPSGETNDPPVRPRLAA